MNLMPSSDISSHFNRSGSHCMIQRMFENVTGCWRGIVADVALITFLSRAQSDDGTYSYWTEIWWHHVLNDSCVKAVTGPDPDLLFKSGPVVLFSITDPIYPKKCWAWVRPGLSMTIFCGQSSGGWSDQWSLWLEAWFMILRGGGGGGGCKSQARDWFMILQGFMLCCVVASVSFAFKVQFLTHSMILVTHVPAAHCSYYKTLPQNLPNVD